MTLLALTLTATAHADTPRTSSASYDSRCASAWQAVRYYRAKTAQHREAMGARALPPVEQNASCRRLRARAVYWRTTAATTRTALARWRHYHYAWWAWMPRGSKEYRVASCETGYGRDPNWQHDSGTYVSAFGIYRAGYADDAHRIGNLSWDETIRVRGKIPTPWEQYQAMQSHRRAHGGWSGWGCRGA